MEAIFAPSSTEQSFSTYNKHRKNHPNTRDNFNIYRSTDQNLAPMMNYIIHGGNGGGGGSGGYLFAPPPPLPPPSISFSYPPPSPVMYPNNNQLINRRQSPPQPPLLPLPISKPGRHNSLPSPMVARKSNRTPKKSKYPIRKRVEVKQLEAQSVTIPKAAVSKVLSSLPPSSFSSMAGSNSVNNIVRSIEDLERFSGNSVFTPSPHPSSLPLPKFSVKPKLSCTAEAGPVVDSGATDNLRRILRHR